METLRKYYLSIVLLFLFSCKDQKQIEALKEKSYEMINGETDMLGPKMQGSPEMMLYTEKAIALDPENADAWRELSIPYLKRGMPHLWKKHMEKAVALKPEVWQPWRGYLYLWFYRDYKKAIADFNASDTLTPNFTDAPQGHSVHYWRGIAYLGLKDYETSLEYFDKYIEEETAQFGENFIEVTTYLYKGIVYYQIGDLEKAEINFNKLIKSSDGNYADGKYFLALIFKDQGNLKDAQEMAKAALKDFKEGYVNQRPYVESMRELYLEDYQELVNSLSKENTNINLK